MVAGVVSADMRKPVLAAVVAASVCATAAPAAVASPDLPPTDPVRVEGGWSQCSPDYPCTPVFEPYTVVVDKTYPSRVVAWAKEQVG